MHSIFTIEPSALDNWQDLRYISEKFGLSHGRLIGQYPNTWFRKVYEAAKSAGVSEVEIKRIEEKLNTIKSDRVVKLGANYDNSKSWLINALADELADKVSVVLTKAHSDGHRCWSVSEVEEKIFLNHRDGKVKRTATDIASSLRFIVRKASSLYLVDPYFQPKSANTKVLSKILDLCIAERAPELEICIHTAFSKNDMTANELKNQFAQLLNSQNFENISVSLIRWKDEACKFDLHARYAVSNIGGIRVDRGFNEPEDRDEREKKTDVVCMDEQKRLEILEQYNMHNGNPGVVDVIKIC